MNNSNFDKNVLASESANAEITAAAPKEKEKKEPLFHITKRSAVTRTQAILARAIAIVLAFVVMSLLIVVLVKENPFTLISSMFEGLFGEPLRIWRLFSNTALLLGIALALTPAFKMKFWNCGGEGQVCFEREMARSSRTPTRMATATL